MSAPTYTICHADGLYEDDEVEQRIFAPSPGQSYSVEYFSANLWPSQALEPKPWSDIPEHVRNKINGITVLKLPFTKNDGALFPNLKVILRMGVGYDRIDRVAMAEKGVIVCNCPDYGTAEVADHALALTLSLRRGILLHNDRQRVPTLAPYTPINTPLVRRLQRSTFGILGLGRIGTAAALRAKAFGFNVLFYDPYSPNGIDKSLDIERTRDVKELFQRSNVLSVHCPHTRQTRNMVNYDLLSLLPPGAVLVNTARGEVVDLDGVERCLREDILAGAGLDVMPVEPVPDDNVPNLVRAYREKEEWLEGRMVMTCHSAFYSPESFVDIRVKSAQTMKDVLLDGLQNNVITPDME